MIRETISQVKSRLLSELVANSFEEYDRRPKKQEKKSLAITYIVCQKIQPEIRCLFEQYFSKLVSLTISNCDLRTFQNFPDLSYIKQLDASKNGLQGSFEFIVKNKTLSYIDVSDNYIKDPNRFFPLQILKEIKMCLKNNPIHNEESLKLIPENIKVVDHTKQEEKKVKEEVQLENQENSQIREEGKSRGKLQSRANFMPQFAVPLENIGLNHEEHLRRSFVSSFSQNFQQQVEYNSEYNCYDYELEEDDDEDIELEDVEESNLVGEDWEPMSQSEESSLSEIKQDSE